MNVTIDVDLNRFHTGMFQNLPMILTLTFIPDLDQKPFVRFALIHSGLIDIGFPFPMRQENIARIGGPGLPGFGWILQKGL